MPLPFQFELLPLGLALTGRGSDVVFKLAACLVISGAIKIKLPLRLGRLAVEPAAGRFTGRAIVLELLSGLVEFRQLFRQQIAIGFELLAPFLEPFGLGFLITAGGFEPLKLAPVLGALALKFVTARTGLVAFALFSRFQVGPFRRERLDVLPIFLLAFCKGRLSGRERGGRRIERGPVGLKLPKRIRQLLRVTREGLAVGFEPLALGFEVIAIVVKLGLGGLERVGPACRLFRQLCQLDLPGLELFDLLMEVVPFAFQFGAMRLDLLEVVRLPLCELGLPGGETLELFVQRPALALDLVAIGFDLVAEVLHVGNELGAADGELLGFEAELLLLLANAGRLALQLFNQFRRRTRALGRAVGISVLARLAPRGAGGPGLGHVDDGFAVERGTPCGG